MSTTTVAVKPELLRWARERAGLGVHDLTHRFPRLELWESSQAQPTLKQLEAFAKATFAPIGYLFLSQPPVERVPIPDLRSFQGRGVANPSPNLLEMIYICQQRQEWYRDYARAVGEKPRTFIGSSHVGAPIEPVAESIRTALGFSLQAQRAYPTWTEALRRFIEQADEAGILVMCSGVVLNNNRRALDVGEFRGFAMSDPIAPLIFINGADSKAAQMFTLAHELAHLWLGQSALTDADASGPPSNVIEAWCNKVAAETLVPLVLLQREMRSRFVSGEVGRLARIFKVSTLVILRRLHDAGALSRKELRAAYDAEVERLNNLPRGSGGNFYLTQSARVSKRLARALVESTLEGQTLYRDAFQMLGISKVETLHELGRSLGYSV
ncbi:MAG: ImmA/IrrE family metallo-endopeptidase [Planctomycetes bacterium]|nr:ImmA/IrrE family metallo-endopeptidase [Planctomycetota bacterium]